MTSSVNGSKFNTPQWDLNDETSECGKPTNDLDGPRINDRTTTFCKDVTILGDLVVGGNVRIAGTLTVGGTITAPFFNGIAKSAQSIGG